jgi:hypothetical protein
VRRFYLEAVMAEPTYRTATVCSVAGVDPSTLRTWRHRGYLPVDAKGDGWAEFSFADVVAIFVMEGLIRRHRIEPAHASPIARRAAAVGTGRATITGHRKSGGRTVPAIAIGHRYLVVMSPEGVPEATLMSAEGAAELISMAEGDAIVLDTVRKTELVRSKLQDLREPVPGEEPKP